MFQEFRTNPNYLAQFHLKSGLVFLGLNILWLSFFTSYSMEWLWYVPVILLLSSTQIKTVMTSFVAGIAVTVYLGHFQWWYLALLPLSAVLVVTSTALLHNASHRSIRPKWLNRSVGELMCLYQLTGFPDWTVIHVIHHTHSDDPEWDPHPPMALSYWQYVQQMRTSILNAYVKYFFKLFGNSPESMAAIKKFGRNLKFDHYMKIIFWFLLLKPQIFSFFFITSIVLKMLNHAWINHATHQWNGKSIELQNFDKGLYKIGNLVGFGIYYHKNHHLVPSLFDPRTMKTEKTLAA